MVTVAAFVAHSFRKEDAPLVTSFTDFLDGVSALYPDFTWVDAESAEPKEIGTKVLNRLQGKTLLIAICTRHEYAVSADAPMKRGWFSRRTFVDTAVLHWKPSDWIIQEIGAAVGLGLTVSILLEEGVRLPGEMQGNLERISFSRSAPEKAQQQLIEQLSSLTHHSASGQAASPQTSPPPTAEESPATPSPTPTFEAPNDAWDRLRHEEEYVRRMLGDSQAAEEVAKHYLASAEGGHPTSRTEWLAFTEWARILFAKGGRIDELQRLAQVRTANSTVIRYLADSYSKYEQYREAAKTYKQAADTATDVDEKLHTLRLAARDFQKAKETDNASAALAEMRTIATPTQASQDELLIAYETVSSLRGDHELELASQERRCALHPDNHGIRFKLAFAHADAGHSELALMHYRRIPAEARTGATWNNMGVAYNDLKLPYLSITAYRQAQAMKESLAMSNLANRLVEIGFLTEAKELCDVALTLDEVHPNVHANLRAIVGMPEEESKRESDVIATARRISDFYSDCGGGLARPQLAARTGTWSGPRCELAVTITADRFEATGTYERKDIGFGTLAATVTQYEVKYVGSVHGSSIIGHVTFRNDGKGQSIGLFSDSATTSTVLLVVSEDGQTLRVAEIQEKAKAPTFYELTHLTPQTK